MHNGGSAPTFSTDGKAYCFVAVATYHWNDAHGAPPGTLALERLSGPGGIGTSLQPSRAVGSTGSDNVSNANWVFSQPDATTDPLILDGTYRCVDSDPATWSATGSAGFCWVEVTDAERASGAAPATTSAAGPPSSPSSGGGFPVALVVVLAILALGAGLGLLLFRQARFRRVVLAGAPPGAGPRTPAGNDLRTRERPGTGNPDAVPAQPYVPGPDDDGPVWMSDQLARAIQQGMQQRRVVGDRYSPPVTVVGGIDTWLVPDHLNAMEPGDKVALAFSQLYETGKLGEEFKGALAALLSPESLFFFGALVAIQLLPGVNVAVDAAAFLVLLTYLGENISDFLDGLSDAAQAVNQQHLDQAEKKLAKALAAVGSAAITALVGKIAGKTVSTVKEGLSEGGTTPLEGTTGVADASPEAANEPPAARPFLPRSEATGPDFVTRAEDPVAYFERTYPPDIAGPVSEAWTMASDLLGGEVDGVAGSYARGCPRIGTWPVSSAEEAAILTKVPVEVSESVVSMMPENVQALRELKLRIGEEALPSDLDIPTTVTDTDRLAQVRDTIFAETGIYVEFVDSGASR